MVRPPRSARSASLGVMLLAASFTASFTAAFTGCSRDHAAVGEAADVCADVVRSASDDGAQVWSAGLDGKSAMLDVPCASASCLHDSATAVAVVTRDRRVWGAWQAHPGAWLDGESSASPSANDDERWARAQSLAVDRRNGVATPTTGDETRTCGSTNAGGGFGWNIIRNRDNVWQGVRWDKPPTSPDVLALTPDQYPLATTDGALCAYATQSPPREWHVHLRGAAKKVIDGGKDSEHPRAFCVDATHVAVNPSGGCAHTTFDEDGVEQAEPSPSSPGRVMPHQVDGATASIASPGASFVVLRADDQPETVALSPDHDLAGRPVRGVRERVLVRGGKDGSLLVAERFVGADCSRTEVLSILDAAHHGRLVREGDIVFGRFGYTGDRFYWVEAKPRVDVLR